MELIFEESENILSEELCKELIDNLPANIGCYIIPKKNKKWKNIESILYNKVSAVILKYKDFILQKESEKLNKTMDYLFISNILKKLDCLFLKDFYITRSQIENTDLSNNRFKFITFIYCICESETKSYITVIDDSDQSQYTYKIPAYKLILFPETPNYRLKLITNTTQYFITGQILDKHL
jgi:hypothetical protein